jgi:DoxX-like family
MSLRAETLTISRKAVLAGRMISGVLAVLLFLDSVAKLLRAAAVVEGTVRLGYPVQTIIPIGLALLVSIAFYAIPRTSMLGAILLTGYLGGATATQARVLDAWLLLPIFLGMLAWFGLYLRDPRLRSMIPLRVQGIDSEL